MRFSRGACAPGSLTLFAAVAALGAVPTTAMAGADLTDVGLQHQTAQDGSKNREVVVFTATTTGDDPVVTIFLRLEQPSPPPTGAPASDPPGTCSTSEVSGRVVVRCDYPQGLPPGTRVKVVVPLPGDYPADGGALAQVQGQQSQSPVRSVPGPAALTYDLVLEGRFTTTAVLGVDPDAGEGPLLFQDFVFHDDPPPRAERSSAPTTLSYAIDPALPVSVRLSIGRQRGTCATFPSGVECELEALVAPRGFAIVTARPSLRSSMDALGRPYRLRRDLACRPAAETDCSNNQVESSFVFALSGDSALGGLDARRLAGLLEGNSPPAGPRRAFQAAAAPGDRPRRADVAVLRLGRGQRGFSGAPNPLGTDAPGARRCSWLSSRRGRFRRTPVGARRTCDSPIWLPARGARRFALRLSRPLPPGRYVVYSRAVTRAGATEQSFTRRDRNRKPLAVRRARG